MSAHAGPPGPRGVSSPRAPEWAGSLRAVVRIALRDARRQARRKRTWFLRVALTGALLFGLSWLVVDLQSTSAWARLGRNLFVLWLGLVVPFTLLAAPLLVAAGVIEEREHDTLDLLALTGLPAEGVFLGTVGSRLLLLLTVVLATLPILAVLPGLGGVGPAEVVVAVANLVGIVGLLGLLAGFLALLPRANPFRCALVALLGTGVIAHVPVVVWGSLGLYDTTAVRAGAGAGRWIGLLSIVVLAPSMATLARLAGTVFRIVTSDDAAQGPELGFHSFAFWTLERYRRRTLAAALLLGPLWFAAVLLADGWIGGTPRVVGAWILASTGAWLTTRMVALAAIRVSRWQAPPRRVALDPEPRRVWGNPAAWRLLRTRAVGVARGARLAGFGWLALLGLIAATAGLGRDTLVGMGLLALLAAYGFAAPTACAAMLDERRARTLDLAALTRLGARGWIRGHLLHLLARTAPWIAAGTLLLLLAARPQDTCPHTSHLMGAPWFPGWPALRVLGIAAWCGAAVAHMGTWTLNLTLRTSPQLAWFGAIALPVLWPGVSLLPPLAQHLLDGPDPLGVIGAALWWPWVDTSALGCAGQGTPRTLIASIALHGGWTALLAARAARRVALTGP